MAEVVIELSGPALMVRRSTNPPLAYLVGVDASSFGLTKGLYRGTLTLSFGHGAETVQRETTAWVLESVQSVDGPVIPPEIAVAIPDLTIAGPVLRLTLKVDPSPACADADGR